MTGSPDVLPASPRRPVRHLVLAGLAVVLLGLSIAAYHYLRDSLVPQIREHQTRMRAKSSAENLHQLAGLLRNRADDHGWPSLTGKRFVLTLVADRALLPTEPSNLELLFSSGDRERGADRVPLARFQEVTRSALAAGLDVDDLTSYAGPVGPLPPPGGEAVPLLADLHLPDVVLVADTGGTVAYLDRKELGLAPEDPIEIGEAAKSPILQQLSYE